MSMHLTGAISIPTMTTPSPTLHNSSSTLNANTPFRVCGGTYIELLELSPQSVLSRGRTKGTIGPLRLVLRAGIAGEAPWMMGMVLITYVDGRRWVSLDLTARLRRGEELFQIAGQASHGEEDRTRSRVVTVKQSDMQRNNHRRHIAQNIRKFHSSFLRLPDFHIIKASIIPTTLAIPEQRYIRSFNKVLNNSINPFILYPFRSPFFPVPLPGPFFPIGIHLFTPSHRYLLSFNHYQIFC